MCWCWCWLLTLLTPAWCWHDRLSRSQERGLVWRWTVFTVVIVRELSCRSQCYLHTTRKGPTPGFVWMSAVSNSSSANGKWFSLISDNPPTLWASHPTATDLWWVEASYLWFVIVLLSLPATIRNNDCQWGDRGLSSVSSHRHNLRARQLLAIQTSYHQISRLDF